MFFAGVDAPRRDYLVEVHKEVTSRILDYPSVIPRSGIAAVSLQVQWYRFYPPEWSIGSWVETSGQAEPVERSSH